MARPQPNDRRAGRGITGRADARREGRPAWQRMARRRVGDRRGRADAGRVRRQPRLRGFDRPRHRAPDPAVRHPSGHRCAGNSAGARAPGRDRGSQSARHPGDRARGMPDRLHQLPGHRLSRGFGLGGHLRPGAGARDGHRHWRRHGRSRRPPGTVPCARRGPRLSLGPSGGDPGRGSVSGQRARRRLRQRARAQRDHRHPEALRRLFRLPRSPQPRSGVDRTTGVRRADPATVRVRRPDQGHPQRDELLLRCRRRAGRGRRDPTDRPAA